MKNIIKILDKDGVFITESHYLVPLIKTVQYDTIYHEHMRYYSLSSLNYLFKKYKLNIFYAKKFLLMEGLRVYVTKISSKIDPSVKRILNFEKKFLTKKRFKEFKKMWSYQKFIFILC